MTPFIAPTAVFNGWCEPTQHKLILYPEAKKVQLFDLERDPWEINNLADGSAHAATVSEMFRELKKWQETIRDPLVLNPATFGIQT